MGSSESEKIEANIPVTSKFKTGTIESPTFGPARNWSALHWRGSTLDAAIGDTTSIQVYGVKNDGTQNLMATVRPATDTTLGIY